MKMNHRAPVPYVSGQKKYRCIHYLILTIKIYKKYKLMIKVLEYQEILCNFAQIFNI